SPGLKGASPMASMTSTRWPASRSAPARYAMPSGGTTPTVYPLRDETAAGRTSVRWIVRRSLAACPRALSSASIADDLLSLPVSGAGPRRIRPPRRRGQGKSARSALPVGRPGLGPDLPARVALRPEALEQALVPERVHALPEPVVLVRHEL